MSGSCQAKYLKNMENTIGEIYMSREFEPQEFIPHQGYAELPSPEGGTFQVRILGENPDGVFILEQHINPPYLQYLKRAAGAILWQKGPTDESPLIQGQYMIPRQYASEVKMLANL
jgi:hypothetical protein